MRYLSWVVTLPVTAFSVLFAISNRQGVEIALTPFGPEYKLPLFLIALGLMACGFVLGALFVWIHGYKLRLDRRRAVKRAETLEREVHKLQDKQQVEDQSGKNLRLTG